MFKPKAAPAPNDVVIRRGILVWLLVMSLISPMAVALGSVWFTGMTQRQSDRQWCELFEAIDRPTAPNVTDPATVKRNEDFRAKIHRLRVKKGCAAK
jgi:hypothetical protein